MSDIESRYKALIQPIKDIAANWDIDIAESLTEYLEDLDNLRISIDGGKSNLNFAEAALLIQGSTAVYSKKVEYLHQLVLQSLEFITNKKSNSTSTAQGKASKSLEDDDILFLDNDASFLLLDHVVEEGHNINLKTSAQSNLSNQRNSRHSNSFASENNTSRVSMSLMHSILSDDQGSASLKLSTSMVDGSGALLLCGSYPTTSTGARFQPSNDRSSLQNTFHANSSFQTGGAVEAHDMDMYGDDGGDPWGGGGGDDDYDKFHGDGNDTDMGDVAPDPFPFVDTSAPMALGTPAKNAVRSAQLAGGSVVPNNGSSAATTSSSTNASNAASKRRAAPLKDMYAQLDPHQAVTTSREARRGKTYKIPAALSKPQHNSSEPSLDHLYADIKVTNTATFLLSGVVPAKGLFDTSLLPILQLKRKQVRQARLSSIRSSRATAVDPQMDTLIMSTEHGEPMQYQNLHLGLRGLEGSVAGLQQTAQSVLQNVSRVEEMWTQDYADFDDDNDIGGGDFHMGDGGDDYEAPDNHHTDRAGDVLSLGGADGGTDWVEETEEEALARRVANVLNEDLNQSNRSSYESICQKYIDNFNQGAHMFAKETQLSRRVAEWTQRLEPILQQQEESAQFDIHAYCETFLEGVDEAIIEHDEELEELEAAGVALEAGEVPGEVSFGEVVAGQSSAEVCRIFLACLQLVNHGSISITPSSDVTQWTFLPETAVALKGAQSSGSRSGRKATKQDTTTSSGEICSKGAMHPFRIRRISTVKKSHAVNDIENYRAPSLNTTAMKGALKSALSSKGKGTKRVQMNMPSNITITI